MFLFHIAIADVSGKGLPAALLMSNVQAALHCHILQGDFDIGRTAVNLNRLIYENTDDESFVTMFIGELEKETRAFRFVRAGHDIPFVVTGNGSVKRLEDGGMMLGFIPDAEFETNEIALEPQDVLCLYTDGVTEARSPVDEEFQTERLRNIVKTNRGNTAEQIIERILSGVADFTETENQMDDVTILVLRVEA